MGLSILGAFASIYHPVGIPWIVRTARGSGRALGINGVFGGLGVALSGAAAGFLTDAVGWRAAFAIPGTVSVCCGVALALSMRAGLVDDARPMDEGATPEDREGMLRGFLLLLFTMFTLGFVFHACQVAFPKTFDLRLGSRLGEGALGVGLVVSGVYTAGSLMQLAGGYLADSYPLKRVYLGSLLLQAPALTAVAVASGVPLVLSATFAVLLSTAALPSENLLLARFCAPTPPRSRVRAEIRPRLRCRPAGHRFRVEGHEGDRRLHRGIPGPGRHGGSGLPDRRGTAERRKARGPARAGVNAYGVDSACSAAEIARQPAA